LFEGQHEGISGPQPEQLQPQPLSVLLIFL